MANGFVTADPIAWASALINYRTARDACDVLTNLNEPGVDEGFENLEISKEALLDLHAPDLYAVIEKLTILWDGQLWLGTDESLRRLMVLGDLRRLDHSQR